MGSEVLVKANGETVTVEGGDVTIYAPAQVTLKFSQLLDTTFPVDLLFDTPVGEIPDAHAEILATFPAPTVSATVALAALATISATMPAPTAAVELSYDNAVSRGPTANASNAWQDGVTAKAQTSIAMQDAQTASPQKHNAWRDAQRVGKATVMAHTDTERRPSYSSSTWTDGAAVGTSRATTYGELLRGNRPQRRTRFTETVKVAPHGPVMPWADMLRNARPQRTGDWQGGVHKSISRRDRQAEGIAHKLYRGTEWQETQKPPAGTFVIPIIPPEPESPCYTPPAGNQVALLFSENLTHSPQLLFYCRGARPDATITVPIRRAYIVINDIHLRRVANNLELPCLSLSMSIDMQSWTWSFSASLPGDQLANVEPENAGEPIELEAEINGLFYRLLAERISLDRTFGKTRIAVSGRGKSAVLADPYSPILTFTNSADRTAQQLMNDALTINNVPLGWDVEWNVNDWLVPANVFTHQGSYMSAVNAIAGAIGAYIQPHPTDNVLRVMNRYPVAPWEWNTVTPDFELPSSAVSKEGIAWVDKPAYNAVYVSGTNGGIIAQVKRTGSAADNHAPMVTDPLLTRTAAARQRGIAVLGDTGRIATVTLELPVLPETGVIEPGKFIRYTDGPTQRLGIVRGTSLNFSSPRLRQSLEVETR